MKRIYLDNAATTPLRKEVLDEMMPYFIENYGNANSQHSFGRDAMAAIDIARERVAKALNCMPNEVYFTSSGTESDNWALFGVCNARQDKGKHIIVSCIEHPAVLNTAKELNNRGFDVTFLPVNHKGLVELKTLEEAIRPDTILVSIMTANNEIGTIQPIKEIGELCRSRGITFHTDAVQAVGAIKLDVKELKCDLLSLSGHKFHGPKGVGILYIRNGLKISNLMYGGAHERSKRPSTLNTPGIVGVGKAIELATSDEALGRKQELSNLRDYLIDQVLSKVDNTIVNGDRVNRLPNNVSLSFAYIEGESILMMLDMYGIAVSSGSACSSGSLEPNHVLLAIGHTPATSHGTIRLTLSEDTTKEEIDIVVDKLVSTVNRLREMSPLKDYDDISNAVFKG